MTNFNNEETCPFCEAFEVFQEGLDNGDGFKESFHTALEFFAGDLAEIAFDDGFTSALRTIRDGADKLIDDIEGECDCDECLAERENEED